MQITELKPLEAAIHRVFSHWEGRSLRQAQIRAFLNTLKNEKLVIVDWFDLKEQPTRVAIVNLDDGYFVCPGCETAIVIVDDWRPNYCCQCGRKLEFNEGGARQHNDQQDDQQDQDQDQDQPQAPNATATATATATARLYRCMECDWTCNGDFILTAKNPFDPSGDTITGCPNCKAIESFLPVCDVEGCHEPVSCGWPSHGGYRQTCGRHYNPSMDDNSG